VCHRARTNPTTTVESAGRSQRPDAYRMMSRLYGTSYDPSTTVDLISSSRFLTPTPPFTPLLHTHSPKGLDRTISLGLDKGRGFPAIETAWHGPNTKDGRLWTRPSCTIDIHTMQTAFRRCHWALRSYNTYGRQSICS
jgi:hypothetical protein